MSRRSGRGRGARDGLSLGPMRLRLILALVGTLAFCVAPSLVGAQGTSTTSRRLVAGSATVAPCGALGGVVSNFSLASGSVTGVQLSNIPTSCNGGTVTVTVTNASTSLGSGGSVAVSGGVAAVPISPSVPTGSVTHVRLAISGP